MGDNNNNSFFEQLEAFLKQKRFTDDVIKNVVDTLTKNLIQDVDLLKLELEKGEDRFLRVYETSIGVYNALTLFVREQEQGPGGKRRKTTDPLPLEGFPRLHGAVMNTKSPSSFSKPYGEVSYTFWLKRDTQKSKDFPIYPGRNDPPRMHIEYLSPIFYKFTKRCKPVNLGALERNLHISEHEVLELCDEQEGFFEKEIDRQKKGLEWFNKYIFRPMELGAQQTTVDNCQNDGMVVSHKSPKGVNNILCIFEFKLEIGTQGDAFIQALMYYARQFADDEYYPYCRPCFIVEFVGPNLRIGGAMLSSDGSVCGNKLVQMFSLAKPSEMELKSLVNVLNSFCIALRELEESYSESGSAWQEISHVLPIFVLQTLSELFPGFELQSTRIEKEGRLFIVSGVQSSKSVSYVIKLCKTYCADLHRTLAEKGFAPQLHFHGSPPSPWNDSVYKLSIMEFIQTASVGTLNPSQKASVRKHLDQILDLMQAQGYVHGDLRDPNILCTSDGEVKLVDFDWSGKHGSTRYPANINLEIVWPIKDPAGALIEYEHDKYFIDDFIQRFNLKQKEEINDPTSMQF